jgi:uncharacterized protein YpmS
MHSKVLIAVIALSIAVQTCCCCTFLGGPRPPYTINYSEETLQRLQEQVNAIETDTNGNFSITVSEEEMTALAAQVLDEMEDGPPISDLQVFFRNDRVELYMTIRLSSSFSLPGMLAFIIDAQDGEFAVTIEEMMVGPLPLPESITDAMTKALNEALTEGVPGDENKVSITDVQIGDKEMTVYGQVSDE